MKAKIRKMLARRKRKIQRRLARKARQSPTPVFQGVPHYDIAERCRATPAGGIGLAQALVKRIGLAEAIDSRLHLLKVHLPYHESDHVLNIAYNALSGGTCLEDIELRRNDEAFLDALGADRIPDPTTEGDFCRRFAEDHVLELQYAYDDARRFVWKEQPDEFFEEAIIDMDGTLVTSTGQCKEGMDFSYKGDWCYHPLLVSLANTSEPLRIINREGNRPSHEGAWAAADDAIELCKNAGFRKFLLRGDTDFTQTEHLDRWSDDNVRFVFGIDAMPNLRAIAEDLPENAWKRLTRREPPPPKTAPRQRPDNVKEQVVVARGFEKLRLVGETIAEVVYRPGKCNRDYRLVIVHKRIEATRGGELIEGVHDRYLFYITNDHAIAAEEIVYLANSRCNQENLIEQLKNGVSALAAPVDNLVSNWAYMVMASLAWCLKAWMALSLPEQPGRWQEQHRQQKRDVLTMEFKQFVNYFILLPAQVVRTGRRLILRLLTWNRWQHCFFRLCDALRC